jgi:hypothetical protein
MGRATARALVLLLPLFVTAAESERVDFGEPEVRLPKLAIGRTYSTRQFAQAPLEIENHSDDTVRVWVQAVVPARHDVRAGVLPMPDRGWLQLDTQWLVVPPHGTAATDVVLSLPYDPELAGHTYQVDLRSFEIGTDSRAAITSRRHRLLFTVEMDFRDDTEIDFASSVAHSPRPA